MWSFAKGCRPPVEAFTRRGTRGEERKGVAGRIERLGSSAYGRVFDATLRLASVSESSRDCGPNENDEPMEWRGRELEGEGRLGTAGIAKLECGGGVSSMAERRSREIVS